MSFFSPNCTQLARPCTLTCRSARGNKTLPPDRLFSPPLHAKAASSSPKNSMAYNGTTIVVWENGSKLLTQHMCAARQLPAGRTSACGCHMPRATPHTTNTTLKSTPLHSGGGGAPPSRFAGNEKNRKGKSTNTNTFIALTIFSHQI